MVRERRNWTAEEDSLLKDAVELARNGDSQSLPWNAIALSVPGRTNKDCRKRFHYKISSNVNRGTWTRSEDERLRTAVQKYGSKWSRVARDVGTRNGDQCSKRWKNTIDPRIDRSAWRSEDEQLLTRCVEKMGHNWKAIVNDHFPGRTALQARNQYNQFCRRAGYDSQPSTPSSMQSSSRPLTKGRSSSGVAPAFDGFRRQPQRQFPTDTDLEDEVSGDLVSSEDEIDDDEDNGNWSQSDNYMPWDQPDDSSQMQGCQSPSNKYKTSAMEFDPWTNPLPGDLRLPFSPLDHLSTDQVGLLSENGQAFEQASNQSYNVGQASGHNLPVDSSSQFDWVNIANNSPAAVGSATIRKQVVIAATCSNTELQSLVQTTTDALESVSFTINTRNPLSAAETSRSFDYHSRDVVITAFCLPEEINKLMQLVADAMGSVSFTVNLGAG